MLKTSIAASLLALMIAAAAPPAAADEDGLVSFKVLKPEVALELAQATLNDCRKRGYQVTVAVVDRFGGLQVTLRDRFAGAHTPETARRKAWTAVSFRTDTEEMVKLIKDGEVPAGIREIPGALMVGGGVQVEAGGAMVGGVGVSGAPGGAADDACARAGIEAIADKLPL
ncbi:MAG: heme-binding protein [Magnetovibrio sp.]|nr:heme-binding protein [Magnetovibrio sp.]